MFKNSAGAELDAIQDDDYHAEIRGVPNFHLIPKDDKERIAARKAAKNEARLIAHRIANEASEVESHDLAKINPKKFLF